MVDVRQDSPVVPRTELTEASAALLELLPRVSGLVRGLTRPEARATPQWSAADTAAHLSHVWMAELAMLRGEGPPEHFRGDVAAMNAAALAEDGERRPGALAERIEWTATTTLSLLPTLNGQETRPWLGSLPLSVTTIASHLVYECLLHGFDIARSQPQRWRMDARHALIAINGFTLSMLDALPAAFFVNQQAAAGVAGAVHVRLRGGPAFGMQLRDGEVTLRPPFEGAYDCHVSVTPQAWLLASSGRGNPVAALASGRMLTWGRRPGFLAVLSRCLRRP